MDKKNKPKQSKLGKTAMDLLFGLDQTTPNTNKVPSDPMDVFNNSTVKSPESIRQQPSGSAVMIPISEISANPYQPRKNFTEKNLNELAHSIKSYGVVQPIVVQKVLGGYELVAGERRLRASKLADQTQIPAVIVKYTDKQKMEIALIENIQREDLNAVEEAAAFLMLRRELGITMTELAQKIGKSKSYVSSISSILNLPVPVQKLIIEKKLTTGHVKPLTAIKEQQEVIALANKIVDEKWTVRAVEKYVTEKYSDSKPTKTKEPKSKYKDPKMELALRRVKNRLEEKLNAIVNVSDKEIKIKYDSPQELNAILRILGIVVD